MMMHKILILIIGFMLSVANSFGQMDAMDTLGFAKSGSAVNAASAKLITAIRDNKSNEVVAAAYMDLAKQLAEAADYKRAEWYANKAIQLELQTKEKLSAAAYYRELGKIQELNSKFEMAASSFDYAASHSKTKTEKNLNTNDAARLRHKSSPMVELQYLNQNAVILNNSTNKKEKVLNYQQLAKANKAANQNTAALNNYRSALNEVDSNSQNSIEIKSNMAEIMVANNDFENAIDLQKEVINESQQNANVNVQVAQMRNLSNMYFTTDSIVAGLAILKDAYQLAIANGNIKEAKSSLIALAAFYEKHSENQKVIKLYRDFIAQLEPLIAKDSSLIDKSLFLITEAKINELEQQQSLKDELISRKNKYNYVLIASLGILLLLLLLIAKAWLAIKKGNKRIALQSLRREMNPHFIFNSLNSVNQFIANNNERDANKYLTAYSGLMRNVMENSNKDYVTLRDEVSQLTKYLELEKLRFADAFDYTITIADNLDADGEMIPNMLIQPNLENAIWHGLRYKDSKGWLRLNFDKQDNRNVVTIEDNGIGIAESKTIKTENQKLQQSLGLKNVSERIQLLNDLHKTKIEFEITEKSKPESGVRVTIKW